MAITIASEEVIQAYMNKRCVANKHSAAATARQQSNDLNKIFLVEKGLNKTTTVQHVPSSKHSFKKVLENTFSKWARDGHLPHKKISDIIDLLAKHQIILSKSCVPI